MCGRPWNTAGMQRNVVISRNETDMSWRRRSHHVEILNRCCCYQFVSCLFAVFPTNHIIPVLIPNFKMLSNWSYTFFLLFRVGNFLSISLDIIEQFNKNYMIVVIRQIMFNKWKIMLLHYCGDHFSISSRNYFLTKPSCIHTLFYVSH